MKEQVLITLEGDVVRQVNTPNHIGSEEQVGTAEFGGASFNNFSAAALHGNNHSGVGGNESDIKRDEAEADRKNQVVDVWLNMIDGHYQSLSQLSEARLSRILQERLEDLREHRRHCHDREHAKELDKEIKTISHAQEALESGNREQANQIIQADPQAAAIVMTTANAGTTPNFNAQAQGAAPAAHVGHDHDRAPVAAVPTAAP